MIQDFVRAKKVWTIHKYADDDAYERGDWYEKVSFEGNMLLNEGIALLQALLTGGAGTAYDNTNARLGVGNSSTAEAATQTGLQGASKAFQGMEAGYPSISGQVTTWRAVFDGATANFAWEEFTVVNAADDTGDCLNRKVSSQGTKASGQTWTLDLQITWS